MEVGRRASLLDWIRLQKTAQWSLLLAFTGFLVEILIPARFPLQSEYRSEGKFSGLFTEPSHVAFALFPCIAILLLAEDKRTRSKGILALAGLLVLSRSSTLIALIVAWVIYRLVVHGKMRQTVLVIVCSAGLIALGAVVNFDKLLLPTVERVAGIASSSDAENTSSLVYVQGWQDAWYNLQRTRGLGLGLNMMGCTPLPDVTARAALMLRSNGRELNAEDGSFLFAKVISETGVFGILFYMIVLLWWIDGEKKLRTLGEEKSRFAAQMQLALIFCFFVSSFVRGLGYFSGGLMLWVVAVSGSHQWKHFLPRHSGRAKLDLPSMRKR